MREDLVFFIFLNQNEMLQLNSNNDSNSNFDLNIYHNLKTVELIRGRYGYGFDLKGDRPSIVGSIRKNSPADLNGLKEGDLVIAINNTKVTDLDHDQVVRLIGQSKTNLILQVTKVLNKQQQQQQPQLYNNTITTTGSNIHNYEILYDHQQQQLPQQPINTKKSKIFYYNNSNYDFYLNGKSTVENKQQQPQLINYDEEDEEEEEEDDYDEDFDHNEEILNNNNIIDESIDSSEEDDCSMQPFYVHKLKPFTNISNNNNGGDAAENRNLKKKFKQMPTATTTTISQQQIFLNQQQQLQIQQFKLAKSQEKKIQVASKNRLSMIVQQQPLVVNNQGKSAAAANKANYLNVNDLYAILSPIIKPFTYNHKIIETSTSNYIFNCNYIGTVHIPYDTLNNALKLSSIRSSIEYFLSTPSSNKSASLEEQKNVCLSIYRDSLMIRETVNQQQFMCFTSTQIGFCGKIKQLNDYFAIIIMSLDQMTSSSCLLFRLYSNEVQKLDLILNLISKIYRNQNYVFNITTAIVPPPPPHLPLGTPTSSDASSSLLFHDSTIIATNLNKKYFNTKLNDINENDELCLSKINKKNPIIQQTTNRQSSISLNDKKQQQQPQKVFQRNTENTQSIKVIKENLTNLFLSKFNNQQQQQFESNSELAGDVKQKKTMSLPHNYNILQVKQDLLMSDAAKEQKTSKTSASATSIVADSTPKLLTTQKLKSKFKKSTFQFLKSKPPPIVTPQPQQQTSSNLKFNAIFANSINNLNLFHNPSSLLDSQRRRLSDYHRPSKVSVFLFY